MSVNKLGIDTKTKARLLSFAESAGSKRLQAERLLNEIDNLALLLHEVRKQTDRIEAAADAIGDAILARLRTGTRSLTEAPARSVPTAQPKSVRVKALVPRSLQMNDVQP